MTQLNLNFGYNDFDDLPEDPQLLEQFKKAQAARQKAIECDLNALDEEDGDGCISCSG